MSERHSFDFAVVRVVPRVDRGEFINAGVILHSRTGRFLDCRVELDRERLKALAPTIDCDVVESYLDAIRQVCKGGGEAGSIAALSQSERFHWLVAPRSTVVQVSPVHSGMCVDPQDCLDELFAQMVVVSE